ncbi:hypothetical protein TRIP_B200759 [uncultured Desulfatiglans sp.]|nr:hypothetical protein TRIP_B200759 [uncultured Desulfatiglans sp.]
MLKERFGTQIGVMPQRSGRHRNSLPGFSKLQKRVKADGMS